MDTFILNQLGLALTVIFGLIGIFKPKKIALWCSLTPYKNRGITEVRVGYGFWLVGLGASALWLNHEILHTCFATGWLLAGAGRFITMFIDNSVSKSNWKFIAIEIGVGLLLAA